jgi:hypothetical protein
LQTNIALAEQLGATVVRVRAGPPADGLIAFRQAEGSRHVIFGQSARTRFEILFKGLDAQPIPRGSPRRDHPSRTARLVPSHNRALVPDASRRDAVILLGGVAGVGLAVDLLRRIPHVTHDHGRRCAVADRVGHGDLRPLCVSRC